MPGALVVSLDFELLWGVRDHVEPAAWADRLLGARAGIPRVLDLFVEHGVHATWAAVGLLGHDGSAAALAAAPQRRPAYADVALDPYPDLAAVAGTSEKADPLRFAPSLLRRIASTPGQELGSHSFSHYYCGADGGDLDAFRADTAAAVATVEAFGRPPTSYVFARNQVDEQRLGVLREHGFTAYRGRQAGWVHGALASNPVLRKVQRAVRLADTYLPLTGAGTVRPTVVDGLVNVPASRFLRPCDQRLRRLEPLRLRRVVGALRAAARRDEVFHLWWHPHNFGVDTDRNVAGLRTVLEAFAELRRRHGMVSLSMAEVAAADRG